ncbi:MAG TPA: TIGR03435 family protein [Blastocatellia bacterium]|nr:TIGR03435 family protein [Blastocatellia bacterium]
MRQSGRLVVDKTNLKGFFDFRLHFVPEELLGNTDVSGPTIFTALQEQLGLKLQSDKGAVEVLVIDSIQKPSEN